MFLYIVGGILFAAAIVLAISSWSWPFNKQDYEFSKSHDYDIDEFVEDDEFDEPDEDYDEGFDSDEGYDYEDEYESNEEDDEEDEEDEKIDEEDEEKEKLHRQQEKTNFPDDPLRCDYCYCHTPRIFDICGAKSFRNIFECNRPVGHSGKHSCCDSKAKPSHLIKHPWHTWPNKYIPAVKDNECLNCLCHTNPSFDTCKDKSPRGFECNRPINHLGDHTYCCLEVHHSKLFQRHWHPLRIGVNENKTPQIKTHVCNYCLCHQHFAKDLNKCLNKSPHQFYECNRPEGHTGDHSYCNPDKSHSRPTSGVNAPRHPWFTWSQENKLTDGDRDMQAHLLKK